MPELWAGLECTVARIGDAYRDQLVLTGHHDRPDDLARLAALGATAVRYPALWETVAREGWARVDRGLSGLRDLGMRPIVGLLHHGSGPPDTSLLDPGLADGLARHAAAAAARYDWVTDWTPVNEPLTTARFSGLYGHWYPHARDDRAFVTMLLNQIAATRAAMAAIRAVIPRARLIQTEDLGHVHATPPLRDQARYENHRRWLSLDLLAGRVDRHHPLRRWLVARGAPRALLDRWAAEPLPPDIVGINHYLSSERFLDHELTRWPVATHGGNGRDRYADVSAYRVGTVRARGIAGLLAATWARYRLPIAVTEAHNGCTREEQARWLLEVWRAASRLAAKGADIRAVTAWSAFGSVDWDSLLTVERGRYEPGLFDVRGPAPRQTLTARVAADLVAGRTPDHPALVAPGWWRRADRLGPAAAAAPLRGRPLLILGARGTLGRAFQRLCAARGLAATALLRSECDATDPAQVAGWLKRLRPWAVINAAGYVRVDDAEREPDLAHRDNVVAPTVLADATAARGIPLVTFSSDLVFDGRQDRAYVEDDPVRPINVYGATKAAAETAVLAASPRALVIRTSAFFGPWDEWNFVTLALRALRRDGRFDAADDQIVTPTYVPDLVDCTLDLLIDGASGLWHLANGTPVSWLALARQAAGRAGLDPDGVTARPGTALGWTAARPPHSALDSARGRVMPGLDDALDRYFAAAAA